MPFGRYRLIELVGRGGMGEVWRAYDTSTERVVAVKLLSSDLANDVVYQQRFRREALAAAGLDEAHVVPIYDFGDIQGRLYVAMRLIDGRDLQVLLRQGPLDTIRAITIIEQVASALNAAHQVGLIHRDVKPSNILVAADGFTYLIDFGIARAANDAALTSTGSTIGTCAYMAPERFRSGMTDPGADVYALTCVLYECLTGRQPFTGPVEQVIAGHMFTPPPQPSWMREGIPAQMDTVIATGMAKDPSRRYDSVTALAAAVRAAMDTPPRWHPPTESQQPNESQPPAGSLARTPQLRGRSLPPTRGGELREQPWWRRKSTMAAGALMCVALVAATVIGATHHTRAPASTRQPNTADTQTPTEREQAVDKLTRSVVKITTVVGPQSEQGTGVVLSADGLILCTNHAVALPAKGSTVDPTVVLPGGSTVSYSVVGTDTESNLAVIRAEQVSGLTPISMGASADLRMSQPVIAAESPPGSETKVIDGVITARNVPEAFVSGKVIDTFEASAIVNLSGGPLADVDGRMVGLVVGTKDREGNLQSVAIAVDQAKRIADALIRYGTVTHATLGANVQDDARGARVFGLVPGGPAETAGVPVGAVINKFNERVIDGPDALVAAIWSSAPGDTVTLQYIDSAGSTQSLPVTLGQH